MRAPESMHHATGRRRPARRPVRSAVSRRRQAEIDPWLPVTKTRRGSVWDDPNRDLRWMYIHCLLELPFNEQTDCYGWGVWVEVRKSHNASWGDRNGGSDLGHITTLESKVL